MKKRILITLLALILAVATVIPMAVPVLAADPVLNLSARWTFDENTGSTAGDITGVNPGTIVGANWSSNVPNDPVSADFGTSLEFDGSDYITIPNSTSMDVVDPYTFEAWVYINNNTSTNNHYVGIFRRGNLGTASQIEIYTQPYNAAQNGYFTVVHNRTSSGSPTAYRYYPAITRDTWVHIGVIWSGTNWTVYYGNIPQVPITTVSSSDPMETDLPSYIGIGYAGSNIYTPGYMNGYLDEVRLWGSALTASQLNDMTPPTITGISKGDLFKIDDPDPGISVSDSGTGVATEGVFYTGEPGIYYYTAEDYAKNQSSVMYVVYDPSAGFVTGGGWIYSPAGAYKLNLAAEGQATFGFVSKYKRGANEPEGNTEF